LRILAARRAAKKGGHEYALEFSSGATVGEIVRYVYSWRRATELMKNHIKKLKLNPAFKQRQVLPLLSHPAARTSAATGAAKNLSSKTAPGPEATATWVTTE
jgi:hypothetical protein